GGPAAVPVPGDGDLGAVARNPAVLAHRSVRVTDPRPEPHHARRRIPDEMVVRGSGSGEVLYLGPFDRAGGIGHLDCFVMPSRDHRRARDPGPLPGAAARPPG